MNARRSFVCSIFHQKVELNGHSHEMVGGRKEGQYREETNVVRFYV
jgi:hypothetical protein